jgi:hypothetical protein
MEDSIRKDLKLLCYDILENYKTGSLTEQLTQVQMLYERLLVLHYLEENGLPPQAETKASPKAPQGEAAPETIPSASSPAASRPDPDPAETPEKPAEATTEEQETAGQRPPAMAKSAGENPAKTPEHAASQSAKEPSADEPAAPPPEKASPGENAAEKTSAAAETPTFGRRPKDTEPPQEATNGPEAPRNLNDRLAKGSIEVGLNDRIAFVKHLFGGSQADFNRVLSQLNGFERLEEAEKFLLEMVKPEYDWEEEEEYEERLLELIRKRFGEPDA